MSLQTANSDEPVFADSADALVASYDFDLPPERIAQAPAARRDASRLMLFDRAAPAGARLSHHTFADLGRFLPARSLLVANNVRVVPVRLNGARPGGGKAEFLLLTPLPLLAPREGGDGWQEADAEGLLRPAARMRPGMILRLADDLEAQVREIGAFGRSRARLRWRGDLAAVLERVGHLPLPPYIRRPDSAEDAERYQTIYASESRKGAAAAPTAGLHFTRKLKEGLARAGHEWVEITLYVGYGTFSPVRVDDIRQHVMHGEHVEVGEAAAQAVAAAKAQGRPVVAVGTTSARALEGAFAALGKIAPFSGETSIFLHPANRPRVIDHLITNFHLPRSTLMMLVASLTGRRELLDAYETAVREGYRFFSYGDAMFVR